MDDAAKLPAGSGEEVAELFFRAFAAAGENHHLEVEEFAGSATLLTQAEAAIAVKVRPVGATVAMPEVRSAGPGNK